MKTTQYKATLKLGDKTLESSGETLLEAFDKLKIEKYPKEIGKLTVKKGNKKIEKVFNIVKLKRFALNPITRGIWAKLLSTGLD